MTTAGCLHDWLSRLVDLERSRSFHAGRVPVDPDRTRRLLERVGSTPWPRIGVHVAGSEGKTSTSHAIAAGLAAQGLSVGVFTSPHLVDVRERILVDGHWVDEATLEGLSARVGAAADETGATYFEFLFALARECFADAGVDAAVWETGLGGRLDATRWAHADVCVITSISLEHTEVLGTDLASIAAEKAGILRAGTPCVLGADVPDVARAVIERRAAELGVAVTRVELAEAEVRARNRATARATLARLAEEGRVAAVDAAVLEAIENLQVRGRMERVGDVLFDAAHSVAACVALAARLRHERPAALLFGALSGRKAVSMLEPLLELEVPVVLTRAPGPRGLDPAEIASGLGASAAAVEVVDDPDEALAVARERAGGGVVLVTGSVRLVGHLLR